MAAWVMAAWVMGAWVMGKEPRTHPADRIAISWDTARHL
jgi:hypothetical protein